MPLVRTVGQVAKLPDRSERSFYPKYLRLLVTGFAIILLGTIHFSAQAQVSGTIFRDYNGNGVKESAEGGVAGITVTAYTSSGTSASVVSTTAGSYSFAAATLPSGTAVRLEFTGFPTGNYSGPFSSASAGNGTSVQFVTAGTSATNINFAVNLPNDFCQVNALLVTPCYLDGAVTPNTTAGSDVLVGVNYDFTGSVNHIATRTQIGSTWGVAYAKTTKQLFTGAFLKRHVGLKDGNLGQIYITDMTNPASPVTTAWLNVSALVGGNWQFDTDAARGLSNAGTPTQDPQSFSVIGATGLGDLDVSEDEKTLYVMDLINKQVVAIDIATKTLVNTYPVPQLCSTASSTSYFSAGANNNTFTATDGKLWQKGYLFDILASSSTIGNSITNPNSASAGTTDNTLYQNSASIAATNTMTYSFPVGNGTFGIKMHFYTNSTANSRNLTVSAEGVAVPALTNFDTYVQAGSQINVGITRSFTTTVTDGVLTLDIKANTGGGTAIVSGFELTTLNGTPTGETRPFALAIRNGNVYVGAICDASHSQNRNDLKATVLELNPTTGVYNPTPLLTIPLTYTKGPNYDGCGTLDLQQWHPWTSLYPNTTTSGVYCGGFMFYTQPVFSDIVFDEQGSLIMGFFDRFGHQTGSKNELTPDNRTTQRTAVGGDLLRAYFNGTSYELENNGKEGVSSPKPATAGKNNGEGIGGGEFYIDNNGVHHEIMAGGIALKLGSDEIRVSAGDPISYDSGGLASFNNTTGVKQNNYTLYSGTTGGAQDKANGLGDLEILCDLAPIEIGNRVFRDNNRNGIQDPAEPGISGVTVTLYKSNTLIATATTNTDGEYYFSAGLGTNTAAAIYSLTALTPGSTVQLRIDQGQATLSGFQLSPANVGTNETIDSDFAPSAVGSTTAVTNVTLGVNGENNHTLDAGVYVCPTVTFSSPAANTQYCGNGTATFTVSTNAVATDGIKLVAFATETDPYSTTVTPVFTTSVASSTATGTKTLTFSNVQLPDNLTGANTGLFVYAILVSADGVCQPFDDLIITLKPRPNTVIGGPTQVCTGDKAVLSANAYNGATYQWFYGSGTAVVGTTNPYTTTAINATATYRVRLTLNSCVSDDASFTVTPVTCTSCIASATSLGGKVYRDFNSNGTADTYDVGLSNITVTLFRCDASNQSTQVATMPTDLNGAYSFTGLTAGTTYRVEFSSLPAGYQPTYRGTTNGTMVQFTQPGSCTTSLGINLPDDYCQTNALLVTPCYLDGAVTPNTTAGSDVLVGVNYDYTGSVNHLATRTQIGSTWGVAYAKTAKKLYTAAFLKRHVGLKDGNLGQIYLADMTTPASASATITPWLNVSTLVGGNWQFATDAARGLTNAGTPSLDAQSFSLVAGIGLGDIDVSEDEKTLYVMDLTNKQLLSIDIATKTLNGKYPVPELCSTTSSTSYFSAGASNNVFTANDGKEWLKGYLFDVYASSTNYGQTITNTNNAAAGTGDAALYANSAYVNAGSTMTYRFPVGNGTFGVKLHFATNATTNGRNMNVALESTTVLSGFDIYAAAGNQINVGITRSFTTTVTDGVLTIAITGNTGGGAAMVSGFELTTLNGTPTGETRPFGLAVRNGKVYVGAVCDASHSQNRDDLTASVLVFDPVAGTYNPTPVLSFPLNYVKGQNVTGCMDLSQWHPWTSIYPNVTTNGVNCGGTWTFYTQPTLSDIEFDVDGTMILGFFDRFQHQSGAVPSNLTPDYTAANARVEANGAVGGDLLRAYFNGSTYEIEFNAKEGPHSPKPATTGQNNGQGIGGGEFYLDDTGLHQEISVGGLAFKPGSGEIRISAGDPIGYSSGGLTGFDNTTGAKQNGFTLYSGTSGGTQNKANGLGDLEILCDVAPIQIGNRVWRDDNKNGIQDPCEPAIPGAVVTLYDAAKTTAYASVTTNAAGEYYFASTTVTAGTSTSSVATTALTYNTSYALVLTSLGTSTVVTGLSLTSVSPVTPGESSTANSGTTQVNNDAMLVNGKPCIELTTGGYGANNHTYDFGIAVPDCAKPLLAISKSQTICQGSSFSLPLSTTVTSNTVTGAQWYYTDASGSSFTAISGATSLTFSPTTAQQPTATGGIRYYALIGQNGLSASCSDTAFVNLMIKPTQTLTISTPSAATVTQCANTTLSVSVSTNAIGPDQIQLVYFTSPLASAANAYTATGGTVLGTIASTTATGTKTLTLSNLQLPDNVSDSPLVLYVYAILVSADGACKPVDQFTLVLTPRPSVVITPSAVVCQGSSTTLAASGPGGTTYQWFAGSGTAVVGTSSTLATAAINTATVYTVRGTYNACISDDVQVTLTPVVCTSCTASSSTIGGTAFRDFNSNGTQNSYDVGISDVTVTIFRCDANGQSFQVDQVQTDATGAYSFTGLTAGTTYRVEFSNLPSGYVSTFKGTQNGSTVQFTQPGSCSISVGLNRPADYCQSDPGFAVVCFTRNNDGSTEPTIIDMQYSTGQSYTATSTSDASYTWGQPSGGGSYSIAAHNTVATKADVSTTFGLTWDRTHKQLLTGSFMRGYAPMQANASTNTFGEASIYKIDYTSGSAGTKSLWLDLETLYGDGFAGSYVADATYPGASTYGKSNGTPAKIGYTGLGSMRFANDGHELYTINLKTQELLVIPVNADGSAVANTAQIKRFPLPTDGCPTGTWSDGRPYQAALGLGVHPATNRVYATVTCTGPTANDLKGIVYSVDPSDASPAATDFRRELDIPLNLSIPATNVNVAQYYAQNVHPWEVVTANSVFYNNNGDNNSQHTQPWLAEIEFDPQPNGIYGMMIATRNRYHDIINSAFYVTGGVLMRGANLATEAAPQWTLEHNGAVGPFASSVNYTFTANHAGYNTSSTNRFFKYQGLEGTMLSGTMGYIPGRPEILLPAMDNVLYNATSGMTWLNRTTGDRSKDNHLLSDGTVTGYTNVNFTKSNNWGGLAIMCSQAPIQIGNRVWRDDNQNGIQDPCEPAIPGVVVTLMNAAKTTTYASVTTNAAGEYYFSSTTVTAGTSTSSVATTALTYNTSYALVITSLGSSSVANGLTLVSVSPVTPGESSTANSGTTLINNDAMVVNGKPCIELTTGGVGSVNHTYDFGLVACAPPSVTALASSNTLCVGSPVTLYTLVSPAGSYSYTVSAPVGVTLSSTSSGTVTATGLATGLNTFTFTVGNSPTCQTAVTVSVSVVAAPVITLSSATICAGDVATLTASGAPAGSLYVFSAAGGSGNTLTVKPAITTVYTVTATTAGGCSAITSATVTVNTKPNAGSDQTLICGGLGATPTSTTLSASPAGGVWSNLAGNPTVATFSPNAASTTVSSLTTGTYGFVYTAANGCKDTVQVTVPICQTYCAPVLATALASSTTLTTGGSVTLQVDVNPAGTYSYTWTGPGTITSANAQTTTVTNVPAGINTFTVVVTTSPGCFTTATVSVTAITPKLAIQVTPGVCQSATNQYTVSGTVSLTGAVASTLTIADGTASTTVAVSAGQTSASFSLTGLTSGTGSHTVTVSGQGYSPVSTTYTAPASCTVAVALIVTPGVCNTATNQYSISGTLSLTNAVAGTATITDGSSTTTVAISAGATSVAYTLGGFNSDASSHTVTVSYVGKTASVTYTAPASCTLGSAFVITPGVCQSATNQYTVSGTLSLTNAPAGTATFTDGTVSTTVAVSVGQATVSFSLTGLTSGTGSHTVTASFNGQTQTQVYSAPASCTVAVALIVTPGVCNTATNQYSISGTLSLTNAVAGTATITDGTSTTTVAISAGATSVAYTLGGFNSDASSHTVTVSYVGKTASVTYTAPASCTLGSAFVITPGVCQSATNQYTVSGMLSLTNAPAGTATFTDGTVSTTVAVSAGQATVSFSLTGLTSGTGSHTVTASFNGQTQTQVYSAPASCTVAVALIVTPGVCNSATNQYSISGTLSLTNAVAGTATITDGSSTTTVSVAAGDISVPYTLGGFNSDASSHTVTVSYVGKTASVTYTAPASCTLGSAFVITPGVCQSATNQYTVSGTLSLTNAPAGTATFTDGTVSTTVAVSAGQATVSFSLTGLPSGTGSHTVTASFNGQTQTQVYSAPASCTVAELAIAVSDPGVCLPQTNNYTTSGVISLTNAVAGVATITDGTVSTTVTIPAGATSVAYNLSGLTSGSGSHTVVVSYAGQVASTTYAAPTSCAQVSLTLDKIVNKSKAKQGDTLTYLVTLTNTGIVPATNVVIRDSTTAGLSYIANSASQPTGVTFVQGNPISTWTVASLAVGQSLTLTFQARADSTGILYNTATIPGDTAKACTSVPVKMCQGDVYTFLLTAPTGRSSYQWYKDGIAITGATSNTLSVNAPGSYSLAVDNQTGQCPDFSCCPFVVEEDTLPTYKARAIPVTCVGSTTLANGQLVLSNFQAGYTYQYSLGSTFNEAASLSGAAKVIPANGVIANALPNPTTSQSYTVRVYNSHGCYTDVTVVLTTTVCGCPADICVPYVITQTKRAKRIGDPR